MINGVGNMENASESLKRALKPVNTPGSSHISGNTEPCFPVEECF